MTAARDEESRASAYIASSKPLFQARNIERKYFARSRVSRDEPVASPEDLHSSRIPLPRKTSSSRAAISLRDAYERVVKEEEDGVGLGNGRDSYKEIGGSPSPAPRPRPGGGSQRERDEQRMRRLKEGMQIVTSTPVGPDGEIESVSPLEEDDKNGSVGSGGLGVSPAEDFTDDWLNEMKRAAGDQQRVAAAVSSETKLFTRGGLGTRVTETAQTLVKKTSASSLEGESGGRFPRTWGRHAKKNPGWLNRIPSLEKSEDVYALPQQIKSEDLTDWARSAANIPLPLVENGSSLQEPTPPHSRPNSAQLQNASTQKSHIWDPELDFTAQSVQESTSPQLRIRNTKLDEIREREIQALSKRAVATARLEEIKERNSIERVVSPEAMTLMARNIMQTHKSENADQWVRRRFHSASDAEDDSRLEALAETYIAAIPIEKEHIQDTKSTILDEIQAPVVTPGEGYSTETQGSSEKQADVKVLFATESYLQDYAHEKTILEEEGEAIPDTPITIFAGAATKEQRPAHSRDDSWENLRKLSRLSATPSPATGKIAERSSNESLKHLNRLSADIKRLSVTSTPPKSDIDPEERIVSEVSLFELQDDKPDRNSMRTPSPIRENEFDETPRPREDPLTLPTPVVTGAYINTPALKGHQPKISQSSSPPLVTGDPLHDEVSRLCLKDFMRGSSSHSTKSQKDVRAAQRGSERSAFHLFSTSATSSPKMKPSRRSRPPLVNSAQPTTVEDDLRAIQYEVEDSTLDDFDGLILVESEDSDPELKSTTTMEAVIDLEKDDKGQPLSMEERERRQAMLAMERMNRTIKSGLVSIRDAKRGIERLENQVSSTTKPLEHNHDPHTCPKCASESSSTSFHHLTIPVPRLWSRDPTKRIGVQLTWIGLVLTLLTTWILLETVACDAICHPKYASTNNWTPLDPFWGGALPTLVNRTTGGIAGFIVRNFSRLLLRSFSIWSGGSPIGPAELVHDGVSGYSGWDDDETL